MTEELPYAHYIRDFLMPGEKIDLIVRQTRWWPGVSPNSIFKPHIIFITNERILIVSRHWLGLLRNVTIIPIGAIRAIRLEKGLILCSIIVSYLGESAEMSAGRPKTLAGFRYKDGKTVIEHLNIKLSEIAKHIEPVLDIQKTRPPPSEGLDRRNEVMCPSCGRRSSKDNEYCPHCGTRLR
ncbi:MAG: zinc-ribbon domain-containing protein [Candidatus Micrarchaeota archaeon]|nr:zinc-ribbon domain-containing protein [Candidatus Micrarchaeota archaeon]MDE1846642.1 zinc-ribbon domain-containing protein [Candidatus Micrarchaeota archaeon]